MWTLKILLLAAGVTVTAFISNSAADDARCAVAYEAAGEMTPGANTTAVDDNRSGCRPS